MLKTPTTVERIVRRSIHSRRGSKVVGQQPAEAKSLRRLLLISYTFPPVGGAGVQRVAKFAKYLPDFGWLPSIVTVANPSVPLFDESLATELAPSIDIHRIKTWEPGYAAKKQLLATSPSWIGRAKSLARRTATTLLQPDPQILWCLPAYRHICRIVQQQPFDAVMVSGPPFSTFGLARRVSRRYSLPLLLDFRDEWTLSLAHLENQQTTGLSVRYQNRLLKQAVCTADSMLATTVPSAQQLQALCESFGASPIVKPIYNGFDPIDFEHLEPSRQRSKNFRLVYNGTLWNLTDVSPLVAAVQRLASRNPKLCSKLEVEFVGRRTPDQQTRLASLRKLPCRLIEHDYLPHHQSLEIAKSSDALCLILADREGAKRVVPAKLFEYLALKRPIVAIAPQGDVHRLLNLCGHHSNFLPSQIDEIATWLEKSIRQTPTVGSDSNSHAAEVVNANDALRPFTREALTAELAGVLDSMCGGMR